MRLTNLILFALFFFSSTVFSQEITVKQFRLDPNDTSASDEATMILDQNDDPCAIIKVRTNETGFEFDFGSLGKMKQEEKKGEIWVYVPYGIRKITIHHQTFGTCHYDVPIAVESGQVYIMPISTAGGSSVDEDQELTFKITPSTAKLEIDNVEMKLTDGVYKTRMELGRHTYRVTLEGYHEQSGSFELKSIAPMTQNIKLVKTGAEGETVVREFENVKKEFVVPGTNVRFTMIPVRGVTYERGGTEEQTYIQDDEKPKQQVEVASFHIGQTEVTQELWTAIMGENPSKFRGEELPVEGVSWQDCRLFISRLNAALGQKFRLPTEAEWELAARGGSTLNTNLFSGSSALNSVAWSLDNSGGKTHTVATKEPNALGIFDMSGNVREWCNDWYGDYGASHESNPKGATTGTHKVCRGGSWMSMPWNCRVSFRDINPPTNSDANTGLRLAL